MFGLGGTQTSARLVRLLLADPLGPKEAWEDQLDSRANNDSGSFLIRSVLCLSARHERGLILSNGLI